MRGLAAASLLFGAACWGCHRQDVTRPVERGGDSAVSAVVDTGFPARRRGELITRAAPEIGAGRWKPLARQCAAPPSLLVLAQGDSVDVLVWVDFGRGVAGPGTYPVHPEGADTAGLPQARVAMQRVQYSDAAYRAMGGRVEIEELGRHVTGRFDVMLREINVGEAVRYRGVFDRLPVAPAPEAWCRRAVADSGAR